MPLSVRQNAKMPEKDGLENTTLPDGLRKELDIRRRFHSEVGQDESPERAADLEFGSQPGPT